MIQNDRLYDYVYVICDVLCTHNSASLVLFPTAPARVHSNIDIDVDIDIVIALTRLRWLCERVNPIKVVM